MIHLLALLLAPALEFPPNHPAVENSWELACQYSECGDLKPPMVIFKDTWPALGYYYFDTSVVFITEDCLVPVADKVKCMAVVIHEMTHYIADHNEGVQESCPSEERAWDVYNAYVLEQKRYDLVRENWKESYPKCTKSPQLSTSSATP
jgi:hypothetical protein